MTNNETLKQLMAEKELTQAEVAMHTGYAQDTVKGCCAEPGTARFREMKDRQLRSLHLELRVRNR